jgi:D-alanyl-D-alanine carboxypeptidase
MAAPGFLALTSVLFAACGTNGPGAIPDAPPNIVASAVPPASAPAGAAAALAAALKSASKGVDAPGAQGAVVVCGQPYWTGSTGVTVVGTHDLVSNATRFVLASTTKTITAAMVMTLVQSGRLSLATPLSRFYPQLPDASRITVRMLLNMTSGLPEYFDNATISNIIDNDPAHVWTRNEITSALATMKLQFAPGTQYSYTDSNFVVLGGIIEQLTGMTIENYFTKTISTPAGMTQSTFTYYPKDSDEFAHPYDQNSNGSLSDQWTPGLGISSDYWGPVWTDGGIASTAGDLARFGNALFRERLVDAASLATMTMMGKYDYGLGIFDQYYDGHRWLGHNGAYGGFESEDWTDPARTVTIAVTTNVMEPDNANYAASDVIWEALVKAYDKTAPAATCTH